MNKVTRVFMNTDLRCQHLGLAKIASKEKVTIEKLSKGEHVLFINTKQDKVKMYSPGGVLSYYKQKGKLDVVAIAKIPQAFGVLTDLTYNRMLKSEIKRKLGL